MDHNRISLFFGTIGLAMFFAGLVLVCGWGYALLIMGILIVCAI